MKKLQDMTKEELATLFKKNLHLQEEVQERMLQDSYYWINEYMNYFSGIQGVEYSISCHYDYINVKYPTYFLDFLQATEKMQKDYCILEPETNTLLIRALKKAEFFREVYNGYEDISAYRYKHLEKWMFKVIEEITSNILEVCQDEIYFCYEDQNQLNYFLDFSSEFDYEVEENKLYKLVCYV